MLTEELTQGIAREPGGEPELVPAQEAPGDKAARANPSGGDGNDALADVLPGA